MIITITDACGGMEKSILAGRLAASRALSGRKVLLLDADPHHASLDHLDSLPAQAPLVARAISAKGLQPELEHLVNCYHDIVIDTEGRDSMGSRAALVAARVAIIAVDTHHTDDDSQTRLAQRLGYARLLNPELRVLFVATDSTPAIAALVARIPAATLTDLEQLYCAVFSR